MTGVEWGGDLFLALISLLVGPTLNTPRQIGADTDD